MEQYKKTTAPEAEGQKTYNGKVALKHEKQVRRESLLEWK